MPGWCRWWRRRRWPRRRGKAAATHGSGGRSSATPGSDRWRWRNLPRVLRRGSNARRSGSTARRALAVVRQNRWPKTGLAGISRNYLTSLGNERAYYSVSGQGRWPNFGRRSSLRGCLELKARRLLGGWKRTHRKGLEGPLYVGSRGFAGVAPGAPWRGRNGAFGANRASAPGPEFGQTPGNLFCNQP